MILVAGEQASPEPRTRLLFVPRARFGCASSDASLPTARPTPIASCPAHLEDAASLLVLHLLVMLLRRREAVSKGGPLPELQSLWVLHRGTGSRGAGHPEG